MALRVIDLKSHDQYGQVTSNVQRGRPSDGSIGTEERVAEYTEWLAGATFVLAFSTFGLWVVTWRAGMRQSRDMKVALIHAEKALATAERAFVFIDGFNVELSTAADTNAPNRDFTWLPQFYQQEPGLWISRFAAQPRWKNGGNTPTAQLTIQTDWRMFHDGFPPNFEFPYRNPPAAFFLAPRAIEPSPYLEMPPVQALIEWANTLVGVQPMILIWGRADYRDIFDTQHFVEWCYSLQFSRPIRSQRMAANFIQWGNYNRTDRGNPSA